jgi:hypothetical protein
VGGIVWIHKLNKDKDEAAAAAAAIEAQRQAKAETDRAAAELAIVRELLREGTEVKATLTFKDNSIAWGAAVVEAARAALSEANSKRYYDPNTKRMITPYVPNREVTIPKYQLWVSFISSTGEVHKEYDRSEAELLAPSFGDQFLGLRSLNPDAVQIQNGYRVRKATVTYLAKDPKTFRIGDRRELRARAQKLDRSLSSP